MTIFQNVTDRLRGLERITLSEQERMLILHRGRFDAILGPGDHRVKRWDTVRYGFRLNDLRFVSDLADALRRERPDLVETHLVEVETGADEAAVILRQGRIHGIMAPEKAELFWRDAGPWDVIRVDLSGSHAVDPALARRLNRSGLPLRMTAIEVPDGKVGLLSVDGAFERVLPAGTHWFWVFGRKHAAKLVDTRWQTHDVTGQDILTRDRVTLRVNLAAVFRVVDPVKAVSAVDDFAEALHRALQLAFRKTLGALTLDQLLADKVAVDAEAAEAVRAEMAGVGIEVAEIALKDVILPGEMREILNQVVAAQKEAEANVIRRREETNATRSLLNTAKVMAENPVMLRLKELEALEGIAAKVDRLTVHNGTQGLMSDLVNLRD